MTTCIYLCPVLYVYKITDDFVSKIYTIIYFMYSILMHVHLFEVI